MLLSAVDVTAFAEDITAAEAAADFPEVSEDYALDGVTGWGVPIDPDVPVPDAGTSPLLHSSDQALVYQRIIAMQSTYPEGMAWDNSNFYAWKGGIYSGGYGCAGLAFALSDAAFGDAPARQINTINYDEIRVGDILRVNNDSHSVIVLERQETKIIIAEGNIHINGGPGQVHWGRELTKSEVLSKTDFYYTRYDPNDEPASDDIEINETNFPDALFRDYVSGVFDKNGDKKMSKDEIAAAQTVDLSIYSNVTSLKGVEYLTALTSLNIYSNKVTQLDISKNTALTELNCGYNQLTSLDISKNTALTDLSFINNQISSIDLSKNTKLTALNCSNNELTTLDVSKNTLLTELRCSENPLEKIDVSKNPALKLLYCELTGLKSLDVSKNTALKYLNCAQNSLVTLDVSKNTALEQLNFYKNSLQTIDVSKNLGLKSLQCRNNQLTSLDLSANNAIINLWAENNARYIGDVGKYDLTKLPGFDPAKATNWNGAVYDDETKTITVTDSTITYDYNCGNGHTVSFTLIASVSEDSFLEVGEGKQFATIAKAIEKINADKKAGAMQESYIIKLSGAHTEPKAVTLPDVPVTIKADAKMTLTIPSLTAKNDLTLVNLDLSTAKSKPVAVTAKKAFTADSCILGALKVAGRADLTDCNIAGALTLSAKNDASSLVRTTVSGKISSTAALELTDCPSTGAITSKGVLNITGSETETGAITISAASGTAKLEGVYTSAKISCSCDLVVNNCTQLGALTVKGILTIKGKSDRTVTGAISVTAKDGTTVLKNVSASGKVTAANALDIDNCLINGAVSAKGALSVKNSVTGALNAQSNVAKTVLTKVAVGGAVTSAAELEMKDSSVYGKLTAKAGLALNGGNIVYGDVSAAGIGSMSDTSLLSCTSLSVTKNGILADSSKFIIGLIKITNKKTFEFEYVKLEPGNKRANTVAKKFSGSFIEGIISISPDNCASGKIILDKGKLILSE